MGTDSAVRKIGKLKNRAITVASGKYFNPAKKQYQPTTPIKERTTMRPGCWVFKTIGRPMAAAPDQSRPMAMRFRRNRIWMIARDVDSHLIALSCITNRKAPASARAMPNSVASVNGRRLKV